MTLEESLKISNLGNEGIGVVFRKSLLTGYIYNGLGRETMENKKVIVVLECVRENKMRQ